MPDPWCTGRVPQRVSAIGILFVWFWGPIELGAPRLGEVESRRGRSRKGLGGPTNRAVSGAVPPSLWSRISKLPHLHSTRPATQSKGQCGGHQDPRQIPKVPKDREERVVPLPCLCVKRLEAAK